MARRYQQRRLPPPKPPPIKWQPNKQAITNDKKIYSIKNGKVLAVSIENIQSIKKSVSDVTPTKGNFYKIEMPESLAKKYTEPQTKLWYYDKRNYQHESRPLSAPHAPANKVYAIAKPEEENVIEIPDDSLVKTPVPNTEQTAVKEEKESLPAIINNPVAKKNDGLSSELEATILPPLVKSDSKPLYTLQSIDRSFRKYRF